MSQNTLNPGLAPRWAHPCSLSIEWGKEAIPELPWKTGGTGRPGLAAGKGWRWRKPPSSRVLKSTSMESAWQRHWGGPRNTDIKDHLDETRGDTTRHACSTLWCHATGLALVALDIQTKDGESWGEIKSPQNLIS